MTLVKGVLAVKYTFWQRLAANHKEQMSLLMILVLFQMWGEERIGLIKSNPINIYLKTYSTIFPRVQECLIFLTSTLNSFQRVLKTAAAAHYLILVEVDGRCQFVGGKGSGELCRDWGWLRGSGLLFSYLSSQMGDELERVTLGTERSLAARDDERQRLCGRKREDALEKQKSDQ